MSAERSIRPGGIRERDVQGAAVDTRLVMHCFGWSCVLSAVVPLQWDHVDISSRALFFFCREASPNVVRTVFSLRDGGTHEYNISPVWTAFYRSSR